MRRRSAKTVIACLVCALLVSCEREDQAPPFHRPIDLLPGSAHTTWIWDAPYPKDVPFFLRPPVPPKLLQAKEGALSLVRVETRKGKTDAPIGGFDFGSTGANDGALADLQGQVFRDLRFGTVSGLILLRGQLKADDVGGPGLSRQSWFVKTQLGLDLLLPVDQKGSLRLILDPRRSSMLRPWIQKIPKRFQSLLGYRSILALGLGTAGKGSLLAYGQLVREPEGLVAALQKLPADIVQRFRSTGSSWLCLGLDLPSWISEAIASFSATDDPMQGGAMAFLSSPLLKTLGPLGDPEVRAHLGKVVALATEARFGKTFPKDPSRFVVLFGLRDRNAFEAALEPIAKASSGRGAKLFRLEKKDKGAWLVNLFGLPFRMQLREHFALLFSSRSRVLAAQILKDPPRSSSDPIPSFLEGVLHKGKEVSHLRMRRAGNGLALELNKTH